FLDGAINHARLPKRILGSIYQLPRGRSCQRFGNVVVTRRKSPRSILDGNGHAESVQISGAFRPARWPGLRCRVLTRHFCQIQAARDQRDHSPRQVCQESLTPERGKAMSRRPGASDEALIELFLDMLAAERGAGENTLAAYRNDLEDLSAHLRASRSTIANTTTDNLRKFLASLAERGFKASSLARRLLAVRQLYCFLYAEGKRGDDPAAVLEGPKRARSLPKVLSIA